MRIIKCIVLVFIFIFLSCSTKDDSKDDIYKIGLMLPFTGGDAAVGSNYERAALMVKSTVNKEGGIGGKKLTFVTRDTHSDPNRAMDAFEDILKEDIVALVGPENYQIARRIIPILSREKITLISPVFSGAQSIEIPEDYFWFRLAPSAAILGRAFANNLFQSGIRTLSAIYSNDDFNMDFVGSLMGRFTQLGGQRGASVFVEDGQFSFSEEIIEIKQAGSNNIVLSAPLRVSAGFVNELSISEQGKTYNWFLSPLLETPIFPLNALDGALDGSKGIGVDVFNASEEFILEYRNKWNTDPDDGAFFFYDSLAVLVLAMQTAYYKYEEITDEGIKEGIKNISLTGGIQVRWNQLDQGLEYIKQGRKIYYSGLTGPIILDNLGQQQVAPMKTWTIEQDEIIRLGSL